MADLDIAKLTSESGFRAGAGGRSNRTLRRARRRLGHHSTIFEFNQVAGYRGKEAARQQKIQRDNDKAPRVGLVRLMESVPGAAGSSRSTSPSADDPGVLPGREVET
ncbi:MAG: hypothetical protein IPJ62_13915 [Betaproteobacteria bacterium]|nr:hypothetical protein [Betaproteobacteria bacterium]